MLTTNQQHTNTTSDPTKRIESNKNPIEAPAQQTTMTEPPSSRQNRDNKKKNRS
jgi:hypothetical protein